MSAGSSVKRGKNEREKILSPSRSTSWLGLLALAEESAVEQLASRPVSGVMLHLLIVFEPVLER